MLSSTVMLNFAEITLLETLKQSFILQISKATLTALSTVFGEPLEHYSSNITTNRNKFKAVLDNLILFSRPKEVKMCIGYKT